MDHESSKISSWLRGVAISIALATLILLLIPIIGWHLESPHLLKLMTDTLPINANTIVTFIFSSAAIVGIACQRKCLGMICSAAMILIPIFTQISYFFHHSWNLGEYLHLFSHEFLTTIQANMSLNIAIGAVLGGIALFCLSFRQLPIFSACCGSVTIALGMVGIVGLFTHTLPVYQSILIGEMSLLETLILIGLGIAIIALSFVILNGKVRPIHITLPSAIIFYFTTAGVYGAVVFQQQTEVKERLSSTLFWMESDISQDFERSKLNLQRLAKTLELVHSNLADTKQYAAPALNNRMGFEALTLVTPSLETIWTIWASNRTFFKPLEDAIVSQKAHRDISKPLSFVARFSAQDLEQYGFLIFEPVVVDDQLRGWLVGYETDQQVFHDILLNLNQLGYFIKIQQAHEVISPPPFQSHDQYEMPVAFEGASWIFKIRPNQDVGARMTSHLSVVTLGLGILLSSMALIIIQASLRMKEKRENSLLIEKRLETLIQMSFDAIITGNTEGIIVGWNNGAEQIFGYTREEVIGKPLTILIPEMYRKAHSEGMHRVLTGGEKHIIGKVVELSGLRKNETEFPMELSLTMWQNNNITLFTAIVRDITERKQMENSVYEAKNKAEEMHRLKSEFLSMISHEMRTPLTSILGYCELLLSSKTPPEQCLPYAEVIQRRGNHLLRILDDLFDLTQFEGYSVNVNRIKCSPRTIVEDVISNISPLASDSNHALEVEYEGPIPVYIYSDPKRIYQILNNLLFYSLKSSQNREIRLLVSVMEPKKTPSYVQFCLTDLNIGIGKEDANKLFQSSAQVDYSILQKYGGVYVNLAIAKKLTELLGGKISCYSEPSGRCTFIVNIATGLSENEIVPPVAPPVVVSPQNAVSQTSKIPSSEQILKGKRILVADDDDDNRRLITLFLQWSGAIVDGVENGSEAYKKGMESLDKGQPYDLVLMDLEMAEMNGLEATQKLRAEEYHVPIIALTAHGSKKDADKCIAAGCNEMLIKPIPRDVLIQKVYNYFMVK